MLTTTTRIFSWLFMMPTDELLGNRMKMCRVAFALILFLINLSGIATGFAYFWKFLSIDLQEALFSATNAIVFVVMAYIFVIAAYLRKEFSKMLQQLSTIRVAYPDYDEFFTRANSKCEFIWKLYFSVYTICFCVFLMSCLVSIPICWWKQDNLDDSDHFFHIVNIFLPWNQSTYIGYVGEILYLIPCCWGVVLTNGAIMVTFISISIFHQTFYEIFECLLSTLNHNDKSTPAEMIIENSIRFRITTEKWLVQTIKVYSPFILTELIGMALSMSLAIFFVDKGIHHINFDLIYVTALLFTSIFVIFVYSYFASKSTESYYKMADVMYESSWLNLPIKLQKCFIVMIANMQRPIDYHGLHICTLSLGTFVTMIKTAFTYYNMLRTF